MNFETSAALFEEISRHYAMIAVSFRKAAKHEISPEEAVDELKERTVKINNGWNRLQELTRVGVHGSARGCAND